MAFFPCICLLSIQNPPLNTKQSCALLHMLSFLFLLVVALWTCASLVQKIFSIVCHLFYVLSGTENFFSEELIFLLVRQNFGGSEILLENENQDSDPCDQQCCNEKEKVDTNIINSEEVEIVMRNLGLSCCPNGEELREWTVSNKLAQLFAENEPSLEEVREAFDVFDDNKDGFIDAKELQRVLCLLGLKEGCDLQNCRTMIKHFDQNGDERIDINEFIKFMEMSFC